MSAQQLTAFMSQWHTFQDRIEEARSAVRKHGLGKHAFGTVYEVPPCVVRRHERKGYVAVRLPFRRVNKASNA